MESKILVNKKKFNNIENVDTFYTVTQ